MRNSGMSLSCGIVDTLGVLCQVRTSEICRGAVLMFKENGVIYLNCKRN